MTESLRRKFKSYHMLIPDARRRKDNVLEASRHIAGMANEQGGGIIYGMNDRKEGHQRAA